jgi:hypothetical protein
MAVTWESYGYIDIEAEDKEDFLRQVNELREDTKDLELPDAEYVDDSFEIADEETLICINNLANTEKDKMEEMLAEYMHIVWAQWMRYLCSKITYSSDGSVTIPEYYIKQWRQQMDTPFDNLSVNKQEHYRKEAKEVIKMVKF